MIKMGVCYKDVAPAGAAVAGRDRRGMRHIYVSLVLVALRCLGDDGEYFGAQQILIARCDQHAGMANRIAQQGQGTSRPTPDRSTTKFCPQALHENLTSDGTGMFGLISVCFRL